MYSHVKTHIPDELLNDDHPNLNPNVPVTVNSGYQSSTIRVGEQEPSTTYIVLNEAMTDIIAEEVFNEYIIRTGERQKITLQGQEPSYPVTGYTREILFVHHVIEFIADKLELPIETVLDALKHGYFTGAQDEITALLTEIFDASFAETTRNTKIGEVDPKPIIDIILNEKPELFEKVRARVKILQPKDTVDTPAE